MTKKEKKVLLSQLLSQRPHGEGASQLAVWCNNVTASVVYQWMKPDGAWPRPKREARMWEYFGYVLDESGNPVAKNPRVPQLQASPPESDTEPMDVTLDKLLKDIVYRAPEWEEPLKQHLLAIQKIVSRQTIDDSSKRRRA